MKQRSSPTDPVRLLDGAGDEAEVALLRAARATPPSAARERAIALFAHGMGAAATARPAQATDAGRQVIMRWLGWSSLAVTVIVAGMLIGRGSKDMASPSPAPPPPAPTSSAAALRSPSPTHAVDEPDPTPVISVDALPSVGPSSAMRLSPPAAAPSARTSPAGSTELPENLLAEEVAALDGARRALREGDVTGAQRALAAYDRRFPHGVLAPEATLLRVESMLAAGDEAGARRVGEQFIERSPKGAYVGRMRTLLQTVGHAR
jgi:TolA-binding protein